MAIVFALVSCIGYGFDAYFIRKGTIETPYSFIPAFITLTINFSFFLILSFIYVPISLLKLNLVYPFIIAGILAPGCARLLSYKGIRTLGVSVATPIVSAESTFSILMALIFLKEPMNLEIGTGILSVVVGLVLLGYETGQKSKREISKKICYRDLLYPITASIFYGVSVFIRKLGLNVVNSAILGATVTSGTSWCIFAILLATSGNAKRLFQVEKQSLAYFFMSGGTTCIAWLSLFYALSIGRVVIVSPVASSYSLVTLFLSYVLLRNTERISLKIIVAAILIIGGVVLLSLGK
jgi:uncharacterized membrane protein